MQIGCAYRWESNMIRKTVTEKALEANRRNGGASRGATTTRGKQTAKLNAVRHGLLAQHITFAGDEEKKAFAELSAEITDEFEPRGWLESIVVTDIVTSCWKLQLALKWESQAFSARRKIGDSLLTVLAGINSELDENARSQLFDVDDEIMKGTGSGWECAELSVEMEQSSGSSERSRRGGGDCTTTSERPNSRTRSEMEKSNSGCTAKGDAQTSANRTTVRLGPSLENAVRYLARQKRDMYRAIERLRRLRSRRLK
jgi:hypothetical protein